MKQILEVGYTCHSCSRVHGPGSTAPNVGRSPLQFFTLDLMTDYRGSAGTIFLWPAIKTESAGGLTHCVQFRLLSRHWTDTCSTSASDASWRTFRLHRRRRNTINSAITNRLRVSRAHNCWIATTVTTKSRTPKWLSKVTHGHTAPMISYYVPS